MAHQSSHTGQRCALHLVVCDAASTVFELFNQPVEVGICEFEAYLSALRPIETYRRDSVAANHIVACDSVYEFFVGIDNIGLCPERIPVGVAAKCMLEIKVGNLVAAFVVIEHAVESD